MSAARSAAPVLTRTASERRERDWSRSNVHALLRCKALTALCGCEQRSSVRESRASR